MDWGRAKSVLIFAFLLLNILLGYLLWADIRDQLNANKNTAELDPATVNLMKQKHIELTGVLPLGTPKMHDLTYRLKNAATITEEKKLEKPADTKVIFSSKDLLDALGDQIPNLGEYAFDSLVSRDNVFVLHRMVDGRPMFDARLELIYSNQKIIAYRQVQVELVNVEGMTDQAVLPAAQIIDNLTQRYLPDNAVITDVRLGYHGQIFDSETQVASPSWRVLLEDGPPYYVDAISAKVATDSGQPAETDDDGTD